MLLRMGITRGRGLLAFIILAVASVLLVAAAETTRQPAYIDAVWVAEQNRLVKYSRETGDTVLDIPDFEKLQKMAVDSRNGRLWAADHAALYRYDFTGKQLTRIAYADLPAAQNRAGKDKDKDRQRDQAREEHDTDESDARFKIEKLRIDPADQSLWLLSRHTLYHLGPDGALLEHLVVDERAVDLAIAAEEEQLWLAGKRRIQVYQKDLQQKLREVDIAGRHGGAIEQIAYDPTLEQLWVLTARNLLRLNEQDSVVFEQRLKQPDTFEIDGQGNAWLGTRRELVYLSSDGQELARLRPFDKQSEKIIRHLAVDPADQSVWAAGRHELVHADITGDIRQRIDSGDKIRDLALYRDTIPPTIQFILPPDESLTNNPLPTLQLLHEDDGIGVDPQTLAITHADTPLSVSCTHSLDTAVCEPQQPLADGRIRLEATVEDYAGNLSEPAGVAFDLDTVPPTITVDSPPSPYATNNPQLALHGSLSEPATLTLNGQPVALDAQLDFQTDVALQEGNNNLVLQATDPAGNTAQVELRVILDTRPPAKPDAAKITVSTPEEGQVSIAGDTDSVEPASQVKVTNTRTGETVSKPADNNGAFSLTLAAQGGDSLRISATDAVGNVSPVLELIVEAGPGDVGPLPPDPAEVAPELSATGVTPFHDATAFLYSGDNPIQRDAEPGAIEDDRATVVRGQVLTRDNQPLSGVTVTIKDHSELGHTLSRADGAFDLVVNGGGVVTVQYERDGYLPVQRKIDTPWNDYVWLPDVVMIPLDEQVTPIDLTSSEPIQVAQGSPVTDDDGTRQATLLFPQGTRAEMIMPDGTTRSLDTLNVRATEYTVGDNGPEAMPGELPPMSGYTYAVELSVDEAMAAGAKHVQFDRPVPFYVDNFIGFPTGEIVPAGWYDSDKAAWVPSDNGRAIEILSINGDIAELDVDGNGSPADAEALQELGITDDERRQLASLYQPGDSLWRTPVEHFTPWDCNWPYGPPEGSEPPTDELPEKKDEDDPEDPCEKGGCVIEAETQVLGETIPVVGTPYTLNYRSNRVDGFESSRTIDIPISDDVIPDTLRRIELEIRIAGQVHRHSFEPKPNLSTTFVWDGKDAFGRPVPGSSVLSYKLRYVYPAVYLGSSNFEGAFNRAGNSGIRIDGSRDLSEIGFSRKYKVSLNGEVNYTAIGGWTIESHHFYTSKDSILYRGSGDSRSVLGMGDIISTVVGETWFGFWLSHPGGVASSPDGNLYVADTGNNRIRYVSKNGVVRTIAGRDSGGFSGDGGKAIHSRLEAPRDVAVDSEGNIYIADTGNHRIRKIDTDGIITTFAGSGSEYQGGYGGDNYLATEARLSSPEAVAIGINGSIYIADTGNNRIRRVGPDGIITTIAGNGENGYNGDEIISIEASLSRPEDIDVGDDGVVYIADHNNNRVRRIGKDGVITTVAGDGQEVYD
ncbi:MAG: Ig-like domain-containing protein, partial [Thiohalophilus sp.]